MLETITVGLVGVTGRYTYESRFFADFFPAALLGLGVFGAVGLLWLLLRPAHRPGAAPHAPTGSTAEHLVRAYGWDTLAYFSLRDDKSFFFCSDGEAMIAYTYMGGYGLASGDPIGRPESIALVVDEFLEYCYGAGVEAGVPQRAGVGPRDLLVARSPPLLPGRRGDHPLRPLRHRLARGEERPAGRPPGRAATTSSGS